MNRICLAPARLALLLVGCSAFGQAASSPQGRLLFHDGFESTVVKDGATVTQPDAMVPGKESGPGGRLVGTVTLGDGRNGKGARLSGVSQLRYEPVTNLLDPSGGELEFWVKLHFDPRESNERTRTVRKRHIYPI